MKKVQAGAGVAAQKRLFASNGKTCGFLRDGTIQPMIEGEKNAEGKIQFTPQQWNNALSLSIRVELKLNVSALKKEEIDKLADQDEFGNNRTMTLLNNDHQKINNYPSCSYITMDFNLDEQAAVNIVKKSYDKFMANKNDKFYLFKLRFKACVSTRRMFSGVEGGAISFMRTNSVEDASFKVFIHTDYDRIRRSNNQKNLNLFIDDDTGSINHYVEHYIERSEYKFFDFTMAAGEAIDRGEAGIVQLWSIDMVKVSTKSEDKMCLRTLWNRNEEVSWIRPIFQYSHSKNAEGTFRTAILDRIYRVYDQEEKSFGRVNDMLNFRYGKIFDYLEDVLYPVFAQLPTPAVEEEVQPIEEEPKKVAKPRTRKKKIEEEAEGETAE
jgi:hypothetical protein